MLTQRDLELINLQCRLQSADTPEEIAAFTAAYETAKIFAGSRALSNLNPERVLDLTSLLALLTVPKTEGEYRVVPVIFTNGGKGLDPRLIPVVMEKWAITFDEGLGSTTEIYREFEEIHPFVDGNGRVGHLLWAIDTTRETGEWPQVLPPDLFGSLAGAPREYKSSFGEVES